MRDVGGEEIPPRVAMRACRGAIDPFALFLPLAKFLSSNEIPRCCI
jgi:hypothetical protein